VKSFQNYVINNFPFYSTDVKLLLKPNSPRSLYETGITQRDQLKVIIHGAFSSCAEGSALKLISGI